MVHGWFAEADVRAMIASGHLSDAHSVAALACSTALASRGTAG